MGKKKRAGAVTYPIVTSTSYEYDFFKDASPAYCSYDERVSETRAHAKFCSPLPVNAL